ncbi:STAS/SEC14 domain-containing protein [Planctomycetota bacterium]|nr:STAS/SEC14 domain-containing protein [Planctomycetota bacterium]
MIDTVYRDEYPTVVGLVATDKLQATDYKHVIPVLDDIIQKHGSLRAVVDINNYKGISLHAIFEELKFDTTHWSSFHRIALVGEKKWHEQMTKITNKLMHGQMRFFHTNEIDEAWQWAAE